MKYELVVARFTEDVDWTSLVTSMMPVSLYNKGKPLSIDDENIDIIELKNQGREAGTWLEHICNNYNDLADWTFFVQADPHMPIAELLQRLTLTYVDTTPLSTMYKPLHPVPEVVAKDRVENLGGMEIRWGLADPRAKNICEASAVDCDKLWTTFFLGQPPDPWWFGYTAQYAVPRRRITDRPKDYWEWLRAVSQASDDKNFKTYDSAWSLELIWNYLFGDAEIFKVREIPKKKRRVTAAMARKMGFTLAQIRAAGGGCNCNKAKVK